MSIYAVAVHHLMHTCPADPTPHPVSTTRTVVHVVPGRPCQTPVTIRCGDTTTTVPCGRHEPYDRQCGACRTVVTTAQITARDLGHQVPTGQPPAPTGLADGPCPICGQPMAAILTRHILCHPATPRHHGDAA